MDEGEPVGGAPPSPMYTYLRRAVDVYAYFEEVGRTTNTADREMERARSHVYLHGSHVTTAEMHFIFFLERTT